MTLTTALRPVLRTRMPRPPARGPVSAALVELLIGPILPPGAPEFTQVQAKAAELEVLGMQAALAHDDLQLSLTLLYELHLHGIDGVSDRWEWHPDLVALTQQLERPFIAALHELVGPNEVTDVISQLWRISEADGPSVSRHLATKGTVEQWRELLIHRSLNQLREADVHTMGIPRLTGRPKAALVEVQADEYGGGRVSRMHSTLFAQTMRALGLDSSYAHYLPQVPAVTLAELNALSYFGVYRANLPALVGHLCLIESTSSVPSRAYSRGLQRLGFGEAATRFFDEHIEADSVHEQIVMRDLAGGLAEQEPGSAEQILFGAKVCAALGALGAQHMLDCWAMGSTSLRTKSPTSRSSDTT